MKAETLRDQTVQKRTSLPVVLLLTLAPICANAELLVLNCYAAEILVSGSSGYFSGTCASYRQVNPDHARCLPHTLTMDTDTGGALWKYAVQYEFHLDQKTAFSYIFEQGSHNSDVIKRRIELDRTSLEYSFTEHFLLDVPASGIAKTETITIESGPCALTTQSPAQPLI